MYYKETDPLPLANRISRLPGVNGKTMYLHIGKGILAQLETENKLLLLLN